MGRLRYDGDTGCYVGVRLVVAGSAMLRRIRQLTEANQRQGAGPVEAAEAAWQAALEEDAWQVDAENDEPLASSEHTLFIHVMHIHLHARLRGPGCFVGSELRVYPDAAAVRRQDYLAPDLFVVLGIPDRMRPRYVIADEGKAPDLVIEVLSEHSLENRDLTDKRRWYHKVGVREYIVIDPTGKFAPEPRLQAWRFGPGEQAEHVLATPDGVLLSQVAPVGWAVEADWVQLLGLPSEERLPPAWDVIRRAEQAEAEVRRLRRQLEKRG